MTTDKHDPATEHPILYALLPEVDEKPETLPAVNTPMPEKKKMLESWMPTARPRGWRRVFMEGYLLCYALGALSRMAWRRFMAWLITILTPVGQAAHRLWRRTVYRQWLRLLWECRRIRYGFTLASDRVQQAGERHLLLGVLQVLALPIMALRRHRRLAGGVCQTLMVTASVFLLVTVLGYWKNTTFALELVYGGYSIGYIEDESVFKEAVDMAEGRIIKNTSGYVIERESYLTLRPVQQSRVLSETELCDAILQMSGSAVTSMSGLYIDGAFEGALATRAEVEGLLNAILSKYDTEADTAEKVAEFKNKVEIVDGLYPAGSDESYDTLFRRLTSTDAEGNPYLTVQIRCTEVYTEKVPYDTKMVKDNTKYIGYSAVRTRGVDGEQEVVADVIYINGVEQYREVVSKTVTKEPVTEVRVVGNYRVNSDASSGSATGEFLWPLPSCRILNSGYGYRWGKLHAGIDISGNGVYGKDIIASDGGVVTQVNASGWGGGYGLYVIIDHGNGYTSVYSHCSEILVGVGQKVTQGQLIARVGNSGNSFGAHLHFEIRLNGKSVDPEPYLN